VLGLGVWVARTSSHVHRITSSRRLATLTPAHTGRSRADRFDGKPSACARAAPCACGPRAGQGIEGVAYAADPALVDVAESTVPRCSRAARRQTEAVALAERRAEPRAVERG